MRLQQVGVLVVIALGSAGCIELPCYSANRTIGDDVVVSGVTGNEMRAAVRSFSGRELAWEAGGSTLVSGVFTIDSYSAEKVNRPDCIDACFTDGGQGLDCGDDQLVQTAQVEVTTDDGRLSLGVFQGTTTAATDDGALHWFFEGEMPWSEAQNHWTLAELDVGSNTVEAVRFMAQGVDDTVPVVWFDVDFGTSSSMLGSTP